MPQQEYIRY
ncbi:hypothetical protein A3Q56_08501 [Intoshia linei]|uniref:Uncharacterized protein n=1 Tax=Intoshia linei TaxID=1819745 RepID=A0A177AP20_9BILA|nr:hypothetical protein A3Q56_08501 [Intoshia linei]